MSGENRMGQSAAAAPEGSGEQPGPSRRSLLRGAAGFAGAGLAATAVAGTVTGPAVAASAGKEAAGRSGRPDDADRGAPVVVHVRDARTGEMDVFSGTSQVRLRDPQLAGKLVRAVR
jgi:hypothetical protein